MPENKQKPKRLGEVIEKRSPNAKHFLNEDGSYTAEISSGILHFEGENNQYHDIQVELFDEDDFPDLDLPVYKGKVNSFRARKEIQTGLREKNKGKKVQSTDTDFHALTVPFDLTIPKQFKKGYSIGKGSDRLTFKPVDAANAIGSKVDHNRIKYQDVWTAADVTLDLTDRGIKETIILKNEAAPTIFSFEVTGPLQEDLTAGSLRLDPAWLVDANGEKRDVQQTVRKQGARTFVDLVADVYGLAYPVEIDPTVTIQPNASDGVDSYVSQMSPDSNYGSDTLLLGGSNTSGQQYESFLKFDVSTINGYVNSGILSVYNESSGGTGNLLAELVTGSWSEYSITWNNRPATDTQNQTSKVQVSSATLNTFVDLNVTKFVRGWQDGTYTNYGLKIDVVDIYNLFRFCSSDYATSTLRPKLIVEYDIPPTAPVVTAPNGSEVWDASHTINWEAAKDTDVIQTSETTTERSDLARLNTTDTFAKGQHIFIDYNERVHSISAYIRVSAAATMTIELVEIGADDYPNGNIYESGIISTNGSYTGYVTHVLDNVISLPAGKKVGIQLRDTNVNADLYGSLSNTYSNGNLYYSGSTQITGYDMAVKIEYAKKDIQYQVQLSTDATTTWKDIIALTTAGVTSYTYDFTPEPETTQALVRVRAYDGTSYGDWDQSDAYFEIKHNTSPNAPGSLDPAGSSATPAVVGSVTPQLNWTFSDVDAGDAQSAYQVQIYSTGGTLLHDTGQVASTNEFYNVPSGILSFGSTYYWKVRVWDTNGPDVSAYSTDAYIKINTGPTATLADPSGTSAPGTVYNDTLQPTFSWTYSDPEGNAQAAIQIQILDGSTVIWDSGEVSTTGTSYQIPSAANLVYDKDYNAKIRAKDSEGTWGSFSAVKYFHLNRSPNAPGSLSPSGTDVSPEVITDNLQPRISWTFSDSDASDAQAAYQVQILDTSAALVHDSGQITSTNQFYDVPSGALLSGKKYHYRVITKDQHEKWGAWTGYQYFYTNASPSTPLDPNPAGASSSSPALLYDDLTPVLSWTFDDANTGDTQAAFQFRLYNELGTLLHDTGEVAGSTQSYEIPNAYKLTYGELYQWDVRTKDNYEAWSNYTSKGWIKVQVGAPTGLSAAADNYAAKILLDWNDSSAAGLSGYDVYRSTTAGGPYAKINDVLLTSSSYEDSQIITDQRYYYVVQAIVADQEPSPYSSEVNEKAIFTAWHIGDFHFDGPTKMIKKRSRAQSKRVVLGKAKQVVQDRGFIGEELQLEIYLVNDQYSTGQTKYEQLMTELSKTSAINIRDPFGRVWKVAPGMFEDEQLHTGKLEYKVKFDLTEVN